MLSRSTELFDRGLKFEDYRALPTLRKYILVSEEKLLVERYTRQGDGIWLLKDYRHLEDELEVTTFGSAVPLKEIYDDVELTGTPEADMLAQQRRG